MSRLHHILIVFDSIFFFNFNSPKKKVGPNIFGERFLKIKELIFFKRKNEKNAF